jgi:23S rRNA (guanosine2251-2'-O)-methyltransferase
MNEESWLEGAISVEAAITAVSRPIHTIYIQKGKSNTAVRRVQTAAQRANLPVQMVDKAFISKKADGRTHGGVLAQVGERHFQTMAQLITNNPSPFIVMLDGVEDPFNFGQAVRAFYAAGADGLILRPRNWMSAASVVARASAGASELMPTAVAETAENAANFYRRQNLIIACTSDKGASPLYEADMTKPLFLLVGGEKRGITRSFMDQADLRLQIPYARPFPYSLGTAVSASVIAFELMRQRRKTKQLARH